MTNLKNNTKKGCFSPKIPGDSNQNFIKIGDCGLYLVQVLPHFDKVAEKNNEWNKKVKSVIFGSFRVFEAFLAIKRVPMDTLKIRECYVFTPITL